MRFLLLFLLLPFFCDAQIYGMGQKAHPDYLLVTDKATTDGVTKPSYEQQVKHHALVRNWDIAGIWETKDVVYVFLQDGSEAYGFYNWRNPADAVLVENNAVTWTSNVGSKGNGTTSYYASAYAGGAGTRFLQNDASITVDVQVLPVTTTGGMVGKGTPTTTYALVNDAGKTRINCNNTATTYGSSNAAFMQYHRDNSANVDVYIDGVISVTDGTQTSAAVSANTFFIFCSNLSGASSFSDVTLGMVSIGGINTAQLAEYTAWNIYASNP